MKLIDKDTVIAELERRRDAALMRQRNLEAIGQETILNEMIAFNLNKVISFLNSLEVKEVDNKEYWLVSVRYVLNGGNAGSNCFFSYFPTKQDIQNTIGAEEYTILHMQNLTEEQFNKLTGREI